MIHDTVIFFLIFVNLPSASPMACVNNADVTFNPRLRVAASCCHGRCLLVANSCLCSVAGSPNRVIITTPYSRQLSIMLPAATEYWWAIINGAWYAAILCQSRHVCVPGNDAISASLGEDTTAVIETTLIRVSYYTLSKSTASLLTTYWLTFEVGYYCRGRGTYMAALGGTVNPVPFLKEGQKSVDFAPTLFNNLPKSKVNTDWFKMRTFTPKCTTLHRFAPIFS